MQVRLLAVLMAILLLAGCNAPVTVPAPTVATPAPTDSTDHVLLKITDGGGCKQNVTRAEIDNYRKGGRAEVTYLVENKSGQILNPSFEKIFDVNPEDYPYMEGRGYVAVPSYYSDWVEVPTQGEIAPGGAASYTIAVSIPAKVDVEIPEHWALKIIASPNTGGFVQTSTWLWLIINMR